MAQLLGSNPDELREKIQRRIVQLEKGGQTEADFVRPRSIYVKNPTAPIKTVDRDWRNAYLRDYNYRVYQAVELKRNARLREADWIYSNIFEQEEKLDKEYVWAWCKIMILAKRFLDLDLLLRYLHALNARENILSAAIGDDFSDYRAYGSEPVMDFQYNAAKCLRDRCDEPLRTKRKWKADSWISGGANIGTTIIPFRTLSMQNSRNISGRIS